MKKNSGVICFLRASDAVETFTELKDAFMENGLIIKVMSDIEFDSHVKTMANIDVDMSDETFNYVAKMAHNDDVTFNQKVTEILKEQIEKQGV